MFIQLLVVLEFLEQKGLKLLQSGQLITGDGQTITFKQAKNSKLLENLSSDMLNDLKANLDDDHLTCKFRKIKGGGSLVIPVLQQRLHRRQRLRQCRLRT